MTVDNQGSITAKGKVTANGVDAGSLEVKNAYGGLVYAVADYASSFSLASYGARLAFSNRDLAEYAGRQFIDIWADFVFEISDNDSKEDDE